MSVSLADLRKSRNSDFSKITESLTKKADYKNDNDDFFTVTRDKAGNGSATIRFLPKHVDDELPYVQVYNHAIQGPTGKWLIDGCPSTLGNDCPICNKNRAAYKTLSKEEAGKVTKGQQRKLSYIANVLIIKDPANPENEGRVMPFKFGKKIFEMITDKVQPTFADDEPVNVFDLWEGADFRIKIHMADGYPSYSKSSFGDIKSVAEDDEDILEIVNKQTSLKKYIDPAKFKSAEALQKRYDEIMSGGNVSSKDAEDMVRSLQEEVRSEAKIKAPKAKVEPDDTTSDDGDMEAYFQKLASE